MTTSTENDKIILGVCCYNMKDVTITTEDGTCRLTGRAADLARWLARIGADLATSHKGKIQVDFAGKSLTKSFLQIEEGDGEK